MAEGSISGEVLAMLFTDIEGSTELARALGSDWPTVLGEHRRLLVAAIVAAGGQVQDTEGDAFFATFGRADDAVAAAAAGQRSLRSYEWPPVVGELRVRMGVHVGVVHRDDGGLAGIEIHRAARIGAAAHGGQVLLSVDVRASLASEVDVEDLGLHRLKDFPSRCGCFTCVCIRTEGRPPSRRRERCRLARRTCPRHGVGAGDRLHPRPALGRGRPATASHTIPGVRRASRDCSSSSEAVASILTPGALRGSGSVSGWLSWSL
jgi:class 3 adenylate cyclase